MSWLWPSMKNDQLVSRSPKSIAIAGAIPASLHLVRYMKQALTLSIAAMCWLWWSPTVTYLGGFCWWMGCGGVGVVSAWALVRGKR